MVHRAGSGGRQKQRLANHQRSWIWGRHLVLETLAAGRWPIVELLLADDLSEETVSTLEPLAARWSLRLQRMTREQMTQRVHTGEHQGYVARMGPFPYASSELLWSTVGPVSCLILDGIQDPHNFGAILRSAEVFGMQAVCVAETHQAVINSQVARSSAGAINRLPIVRVPELEPLLNAFREHQVPVWGASEKGTVHLDRIAIPDSIAFVIGNEGRGIRPEIQACCDQLVQIPMAGQVGSLNAAAAAAIFSYVSLCARRSRPQDHLASSPVD